MASFPQTYRINLSNGLGMLSRVKRTLRTQSVALFSRPDPPGDQGIKMSGWGESWLTTNNRKKTCSSPKTSMFGFENTKSVFKTRLLIVG